MNVFFFNFLKMFGWLNKIYNFVFQSALFMENNNYKRLVAHQKNDGEKL